MSADALVVGGSIHTRLELRRRLRAKGFRVTLESSTRRGLARLGQHSFAVCALDLTDVPQARQWKRRYGAVVGTRGTELLDLTRPKPRHEADGGALSDHRLTLLPGTGVLRRGS